MEVINEYIQSLGASEMLRFHDVVSFDEEGLEWVPQPVLAALLTFPWVKAIRDHNAELVAKQRDEGYRPPASVYYMRQTAQNACGTVGILHALLNLYGDRDWLFRDNSFVERFLKDTREMDADERAQHLTDCKRLNQVSEHDLCTRSSTKPPCTRAARP